MNGLSDHTLQDHGPKRWPWKKPQLYKADNLKGTIRLFIFNGYNCKFLNKIFLFFYFKSATSGKYIQHLFRLTLVIHCFKEVCNFINEKFNKKQEIKYDENNNAIPFRRLKIGDDSFQEIDQAFTESISQIKSIKLETIKLGNNLLQNFLKTKLIMAGYVALDWNLDFFVLADRFAENYNQSRLDSTSDSINLEQTKLTDIQKLMRWIMLYVGNKQQILTR